MLDTPVLLQKEVPSYFYFVLSLAEIQRRGKVEEQISKCQQNRKWQKERYSQVFVIFIDVMQLQNVGVLN